MSNALVTIKGTIANTTIFQPKNGQNGKPVLKIDVLQINDMGTHVETIKDDDLNAVYITGAQIETPCVLTPWAFDKKNGASLKIYKGNTVDIKLEQQETVKSK